MQTKLQLTNSCLISVVKWVIHKPGDERGLAHALLSQEDKLELPQRVAGPEVCWRRHFWPCCCFLAKRPYKIARVWSLKHWKIALLGADSGQIWALGEGSARWGGVPFWEAGSKGPRVAEKHFSNFLSHFFVDFFSSSNLWQRRQGRQLSSVHQSQGSFFPKQASSETPNGSKHHCKYFLIVLFRLVFV